MDKWQRDKKCGLSLAFQSRANNEAESAFTVESVFSYSSHSRSIFYVSFFYAVLSWLSVIVICKYEKNFAYEWMYVCMYVWM